MTTITLNNTLEEIEFKGNTSYRTERFTADLQRKIGDNYKLLSSLPEDCETLQLGFLGMLSEAYSQHMKVEIAPHDVWYIVMTEVADIIKTNAEACRPLFTKANDKVTILVPTNDATQIDLNQVIAQLKGLVPVDINLFAPEFSTLNEDSRMAFYAALCDGLQVYYNYMTYCCGIPQVRVSGILVDWQLMQTNFVKISDLFSSVGLEKPAQYLSNVSELVGDIIKNTFEMQNAEFWKDIYTQENIGSGGELTISGWITKLFYRQCELPKLENFPSTISMVPYTNVNSGWEFMGVNGAFKRIRMADGFVKTGYGQLVYHKEKR